MIFKDSKFILLLLVFIFLFLLALGTLGLYQTMAKSKQSMNLLVEANRIARERDSAQLIKIVQNETAEDLVSFNKIILSREKLVPFIDNIEELGRKLNLKADTLSVGNSGNQQSPGPEVITLTIESEGSWGSTITFIKAIENLPQRVIIKSVDLSKSESGWRLKITFSLYLFD